MLKVLPGISGNAGITADCALTDEANPIKPAKITVLIFRNIGETFNQGCAGFQASLPPKTDSTVIFSATSLVNCLAHLKHAAGFAPGSVLLYLAVFLNIFFNATMELVIIPTERQQDARGFGSHRLDFESKTPRLASL